ncbi:MAG: hypothetical protein AAGD25_08375 [Cyanobacteria bacterium P01_F01_bin.150]
MGKSACRECRKENVETKAPSTSSQIQPSWIQQKSNSGGDYGNSAPKSPLSKMSRNVLQSYRKRAANIQRKKKSTQPSLRIQRSSIGLGGELNAPGPIPQKKDTVKELEKHLRQLKVVNERGTVVAESDPYSSYKKGKQEKSSIYAGLCNYTDIDVKLKDGFKPSLISGTVCTGNKGSFGGRGFCVERVQDMTVFDPNNHPIVIKMPVGCEPRVPHSIFNDIASGQMIKPPDNPPFNAVEERNKRKGTCKYIVHCHPSIIEQVDNIYNNQNR